MLYFVALSRPCATTAATSDKIIGKGKINPHFAAPIGLNNASIFAAGQSSLAGCTFPHFPPCIINHRHHHHLTFKNQWNMRTPAFSRLWDFYDTPRIGSR